MHYRELPLARKAVEGLPEIQEKHDGVYKICAKGKNTKEIHFDVYGPCHQVH